MPKKISKQHFPLVKSIITDQNGEITDVIMSINDYFMLENKLLDYCLGRSMQEVADEDEIPVDEAEKILRS